MHAASGACLRDETLDGEPSASIDDPFIRDLLAAQHASGISGAELARRVGIHPALWSRVRRGMERFGPQTIVKILTVYPHLSESAAEYLSHGYDEPTLRLLRSAAEHRDRWPDGPHGAGDIPGHE